MLGLKILASGLLFYALWKDIEFYIEYKDSSMLVMWE